MVNKAVYIKDHPKTSVIMLRKARNCNAFAWRLSLYEIRTCDCVEMACLNRKNGFTIQSYYRFSFFLTSNISSQLRRQIQALYMAAYKNRNFPPFPPLCGENENGRPVTLF